MRPPKPRDPKRSALMARVRQRGTAAELMVGATLRASKTRYRLNVRSLPGSPDFANRKRKWAIFVHGCFWHHHTACRRASIPKENRAFWCQKFVANRARDARAIRALRRAHFRVMIVWECEISDPQNVANRLSKVLKAGRIDMPEAVDHRCVVIDVPRLRGRGIRDQPDGRTIVTAIHHHNR
jgi:DNA mismatch endonuclease, patch repair protein